MNEVNAALCHHTMRPVGLNSHTSYRKGQITPGDTRAINNRTPGTSKPLSCDVVANFLYDS